MSHNAICTRIRFAVSGAVICLAGLLTFLASVLNSAWQIGAESHPMLILWSIIVMIGAVPVVCAAVFGWSTSTQVARDQSFSRRTAQLLGRISTCALIEAGYILAGNLIIAIADFRYLSGYVIFVSLMMMVFALAGGMAFAAIGRFVQKAAELQEESDLTV